MLSRALRMMKELGSWGLAKTGRRMSRAPLAFYLKQFDIDAVFDVGANIGQFAGELRKIGYAGQIDSFEPLSTAFAKLKSPASRDGKWNAHPFALGDQAAELEINVLAHDLSSSFLDVKEGLGDGQVDFRKETTEKVLVRTLDDVFPELCTERRNRMLKIDAQGYEKNIVLGASHSLGEFKIVLMELSLVQNYDGEPLIEELFAMMRERGFDPWWLSDAFRNLKTMQLYQCDVTFVRRDS